MATQAQRNRRRRQRQRKAARRGINATHLPQMVAQVMPYRSRNTRGRRRSRRSKGLFGNIGNALLPGIGGTIGNVVDHFLPFGKSAPVNLRNQATSRQVNYSFEQGSEKLTTVTVPAGTPPGTALFQTFVNSSTLGVRMASFANLWDKTKYLDILINVTSSAPTTTPGAYIHAIDPDPVVPYVSSDELPNRMMALQTCETVSAWAPSTLRLKRTDGSFFNFFDAESASDAEYRQFAPGRYILATNTEFSESVDLTLTVDWAVLFERPVLANIDNNGPGVTYLLSIQSTTTDFTTDSTNTVLCVNDAAYWSRIRPPAGTYAADFRITLDSGVGSATYNVSSIVVAPGNGLTLTVSPNPAASTSYRAYNQTPNPYIINVPAPSAGRWRSLVTTGYCKHHPFIRVEQAETNWMQRANLINECRLKAIAQKEALHKYIVQSTLQSMVDNHTPP